MELEGSDKKYFDLITERKYRLKNGETPEKLQYLLEKANKIEGVSENARILAAYA